MRRVARRARKAWRRSHKARTTNRHTWRKREKARLYAMSLLPAAWPDARPRRRARNAALAETLGAERDLMLVMARLAADHPVNGEARALRDLRKVEKRLSKRVNKLGWRLHAEGS